MSYSTHTTYIFGIKVPDDKIKDIREYFEETFDDYENDFGKFTIIFDSDGVDYRINKYRAEEGFDTYIGIVLNVSKTEFLNLTDMELQPYNDAWNHHVVPILTKFGLEHETPSLNFYMQTW